jgi:type I restriction enzyme M protein
MSEWGKQTISEEDPRFKYGLPPSNNANFAFIQHMIYHLDESGMAGTVMANGSMSAQGSEGDIRENIIKDNMIDVVISLPKELFYTTQIPVCIWILSKGKDSDRYRDRSGETLFIDARDLYESIDRSTNRLTRDHINKISNTVRAYRGEDEVDDYEDETGYCKVASTDEIANNDYIITPGRYVGVTQDRGDDVAFEVKMEELSSKLREELERSEELGEEIEDSLRRVGF